MRLLISASVVWLAACAHGTVVALEWERVDTLRVALRLSGCAGRAP